MTSVTHWTERSTEDFLYSIASDFIEDLKEKMQTLGMTQSELAKEAKVHKSFVSRVFKDPGNLTLETIVKFARTVRMKVSIVPYEDPNDPYNTRGPVGSDVFRWCWEHANRPADMWSIDDRALTTANTLNLEAVLKGIVWGQEVFVTCSSESLAGSKIYPLSALSNIDKHESTPPGDAQIDVTPLQGVLYGGR